MVASVHDLWGNVPLMLSGLSTDYKVGLWQEALLFKQLRGSSFRAQNYSKCENIKF